MKSQLLSFCPYCGAPSTGGGFCGKCGKSISPFTDKMTEQGCYCPKCGSTNKLGNTFCSQCGTALSMANSAHAQPSSAGAPPQPPVYVFQQQVIQPTRSAEDTDWPVKDRTIAGVLAICLGGLGIHKFYLNKIGTGILYLCFCWTGIPAVIGLIEGIIYLCGSDENFERTQHVRVK